MFYDCWYSASESIMCAYECGHKALWMHYSSEVNTQMYHVVILSTTKTITEHCSLPARGHHSIFPETCFAQFYDHCTL